VKLVLASAALALAGCVAAPPPTTSAPQAAAPAAAPGAQTAQAKDEQPKKICRRMNQTGSLQPQRVCSTAEEWAEFDRLGREGVDRMNELRRSGGITGDVEGQPQGVNPERALRQ
jgi:hypothetical protein